MLYQFNLICIPKQQANAAVCALALRSYATGADLKKANVIKNPDPAALRRGTGGRSSFNGYVCTVFGATGFLGQSVSNQLGKIGTQLIIPYRGNFDDEETKGLKLVGDLGQVLFSPFYLKDEASIKKAVKYSNVVINLIGRHFETRNFSYDDVHVKGARAIAKACKEVGVERLIHVSALKNEEPQSFYYRKPIDFFPSKLRGELAVLDEFPDATIVRPASMFGWYDKFLWNLFERRRAFLRSIPVWAKGKNTIKQPVFVTDVGKGIVKLMLDHTSKGKIFQFIGPERYYLEEIIKYGLALSERDRYGWSYHDARFDPMFYLKLAFNQSIVSMNWHLPKNNLHYQMFEIECNSERPIKKLPGLLDVGIEPTPLEQLMPPIMTVFFLAESYYLRAPEEFRPVPPPAPVTRGLYG